MLTLNADSQISNNMLKNLYSISTRHLFKNKVFSLINLSGLTIGLALFVLIIKWVQYEYSYNDFHVDGDRIASIQTNKAFTNGELATFPAVPSALSTALMRDFPEVQYASTTSWGDQRQFSINDKEFVEYGLYVSPEFLKVFSFPLIRGDADQALGEPNTIIISEKLARKYFGEEDPMGRSVLIERDKSYKITGVTKDIPANATLTFDFLMPVQDYFRDYDWVKESWDNSNVRAYVKLHPNVDRLALESKLRTYLHNKSEQQLNSDLILWDLKDWYLRLDFKNGQYAGGGRIVYVRLFLIIAFFVLFLACINFMNLSTAQATQRAKEVGVRKAIGASRYSLIKQFMAESVFLALLAGALAILLVQLVLPGFNSFLRKDISIDLGDLQQMFYYGCIILITGIIAGSYPALVLSAFRPIAVLKSAFVQATVSTGMIRKSLVVTQFVVSIMLIISTLLISQQIDFIKKKNLGFNVNQLVWFPNNIPLEKCGLAMEQMKRIPGVAHAAQASVTFSMANNRTSDVSWPGKAEGNDVFFNLIASSHELVETMGLTIKEGRSFSQKFAQDTGAFILNEEAVIKMGLVDPIGKTISTPGGSGKIVGIVKDFHMESLHNPISPVLITCRPDWTWLMYCRLSGNDVQSTLKEIESVYHQFAPGFIFDFNFQDKEYERLYRSETQVGTLVKWFAGFAIFISCLGLLGLTLFTIERKAKEIGIRKVLGATLNNITNMLTSEFLGLIFISLMIASPVAYYLMTKWLGGFAYRIDIEWWIFALAGSITIGISVFTILIQAVKAAMANPVKALRSE
jgi:ABC-type antimicrobial peptide transport system permease subunit